MNQQQLDAQFAQAKQQLKTLCDYVRFGVSRFEQANLYYGHGTDNAADEAFYLLRHVLHLPHDLPPYMINSRLTDLEKEQVLDIYRQRIITRKPAPYLTHECHYAGLDFYVDERVLIPRSGIVELIEHGFEPWIDSDRVESILDLCTGSACIAISCALAFPEAKVWASDISADALEVAKINVQKHHCQQQVTLFKSDVFEGIPPEQTFDVIVSNPPYVDAEDMAALPDEYRHEPAMALASGDDGLDVTRKILSQAAARLNPGGILVVEVGNSQVHVLEQFPELLFNWPELERGGSGVFILTREQFQDSF